MSMYNFLEYCKNYEKITRTLWHFHRDEPEDGAVGNRNEKTTIYFTDSKLFIYKTKITGELDAGENRKNSIKVVAPLKHLRNFWRTFKYLID